MGQGASCFPGADVAKPAKMYLNERKIAVGAVIDACKVCKKVQENLVSDETITKKDRSPVTVADFASQAIVIGYLSKAFPEDPIIAEESSKSLKDNPEMVSKILSHVKEFFPEMNEQILLETINKGSNKTAEGHKRWWTLDPVDGTLGFLRKEQYAVALALMENNEPILGILGCPNLPLNLRDDKQKGCLLVAVRGNGAFQRSIDDSIETKIQVSSVCEPEQAITTESVEKSHSSHDLNADIAAHLLIKVPPIRMDSQCKYAVVARGDSSIYLRLSELTYKEKIWDHAAGVAIVREAGGKVTDFDGKPLDFSKGRTLVDNVGIMCTNGWLHEAVLESAGIIRNKT